MSERKLFFPGIGGNRYEVSLEELKDLAYKGKIKREDKLILRETKDGNSTEIVFVCSKIKGLEEQFSSGERDRQAELERKDAEREAERLAEEKRRQEEEQRLEEGQKSQEQQTLEEEIPELSSTEEAILDAVDAIHGIADIVMTLGVVLGLVELVGCLILGAERQNEGLIVMAFIAFAVSLTLFWIVRKVLLCLMMTPVRLAQYQTEAIVKAIQEAAGKSNASNFPLSDGGVANPSVHNSNR